MPLLQSGLHSALSSDSSLGATAQGISWNFFDKGVVVQLRSNYLGSPDPDSAVSSGIWDDFLGLCRAYRPQRPFDSIVLAIPCAALLQGDPQGQLALVARAKAIHRRLWLAQNRLALRFPIHLVITECEGVPGFATFGAALPEPLRRSMLGWVSPYELVAPFRVQWVDGAMDQIVGAVADACAELSALETADADSSAYFLLPGDVERLRGGLKIFCEELMRPSAYHESFLLRGMYLTGDASAAAILQASAAGQAGAPPVVSDALAVDHFMADAVPLPVPVALAGHAAASGLAADAGLPVFLRDIFERKIFAEVGLVRSSARRLPRPATSRLVYWCGLLVPLSWAAGLLVATFQLHQTGTDMVNTLKLLDQSATGASNTPAGASVSVASQQKVITGLDSMAQLANAHFGSIFMPGSWPLFNQLHEQLQSRLEKGFASNAVTVLHGAVYTRMAQLTAPRQDQGTGSPGNSQCALPYHWNMDILAAGPVGLDLSDMPEHRAVLKYLDRVDTASNVVSALQRLEGADNVSAAVAASGDDLALVVDKLLHKKMRGRLTLAAALFRAAAHDKRVEIEPLQAAALCSLNLANTAMYRRLYDDNALLVAQEQVSSGIAAVQEAAPGGDLGRQLRLWRALAAALDEQQRLLATQSGGWMHADAFQPNPEQRNLSERIGRNSLLGTAAVRASEKLAADGFARFKAARAALDGTPGTPGAPGGDTGGLLATASGWAFTPGRKQLHDAVAALLAPAYMGGAVAGRMPEVPAGASVRWDRSLLERVASLAEARKTFLGSTYNALPAALQQPANQLVDLALAGSAQSALVQALGMGPAELPGADSDSDRTRVQSIRNWLGDLKADDIVKQLDSVLTQDALARLARLNDVFNAAQVYLPREATFQSWLGEKGAMADAFGGGDAAGLAAYLERQQEFIDTAGKQAERVLEQLNRTAPGQPLVERWQALSVDQRRYRLKSPTSSQLALEQFIVGSADIDTGNCADKLPARPSPLRPADLYAERLQRLQGALLARCRALVAGADERRWQLFANAYNRDLAPRLPFAPLVAGRAGGDVLPADRADVDAVMALYESARAADALAKRPAWGAALPGARPAVRLADLQLRSLAAVLAPLKAGDDGQSGGLDVSVKFRVNMAAEVDANNIIDWRLTIGSGTVRMGEPARALRWEPGMPVQLSLRLAQDGPVVPQMEAGRPHMSVAERTVSFRFDDPWALFTFIGSNREANVPGDDGREPLLRFEFPLAGGATPSLPPAAPRARVFLRLSVSAPGKHTPLPWPKVLPSQVPAWSEPQVSQL